jgi:hypothetical protein
MIKHDQGAASEHLAAFFLAKASYPIFRNLLIERFCRVRTGWSER